MRMVSRSTTSRSDKGNSLCIGRASFLPMSPRSESRQATSAGCGNTNTCSCRPLLLPHVTGDHAIAAFAHLPTACSVNERLRSTLHEEAADINLEPWEFALVDARIADLLAIAH